MKGCSAFLEMKRCKDWDNEISSWKYLTCSTRFPGAQSASLYPELRGCWRSVTAAAKGSVTAECLVLVARSCPTLCNPMDCSPPGSSVHGISQARILEWVAISFSPWDLPDPGLEPVSLMSLALAGGSLLLAPPGKTLCHDLLRDLKLTLTNLRSSHTNLVYCNVPHVSKEPSGPIS